MHRYPGVPEVLAIHADVCARVRGQNLMAEDEAVPPEIQGLARAGWRGPAQEGGTGQAAGGPQA
eukprot:1829822-Lingulodinium_polyedra.AAC.1